MLLRGSSLRNTEYAYGLVVFTGHETKIMKNSSKSKPKYSKVEKDTGKYIVLVILMQMIICLVAGIYGAIW